MFVFLTQIIRMYQDWAKAVLKLRLLCACGEISIRVGALAEGGDFTNRNSPFLTGMDTELNYAADQITKDFNSGLNEIRLT